MIHWGHCCQLQGCLARWMELKQEITTHPTEVFNYSLYLPGGDHQAKQAEKVRIDLLEINCSYCLIWVEVKRKLFINNSRMSELVRNPLENLLLLIWSYWYDYTDIIELTCINWANMLPWNQSWMTDWRVNMSMMWSYQYDQNDFITLIWSYTYMIILIWSYHTSIY